jgi:hypothetical protein
MRGVCDTLLESGSRTGNEKISSSSLLGSAGKLRNRSLFLSRARAFKTDYPKLRSTQANVQRRTS